MEQPIDTFDTRESLRSVTWILSVTAAGLFAYAAVALEPRCGVLVGLLCGAFGAAVLLCILFFAWLAAGGLTYDVSDAALVVVRRGRVIRIIPRDQVRA
jgi:hypothetical protein